MAPATRPDRSRGKKKVRPNKAKATTNTRSRPSNTSSSTGRSTTGRKRKNERPNSNHGRARKSHRHQAGVAAADIKRDVPPWPQYLPYEVMLQIFQFAAYPLYNELFQSNPSVQWLVKTAGVCRSFMEPALSALYYSPPLTPAHRAHGLLKHLRNQDGTGLLNYSTKIRYLDIDALEVSTLKFAGNAPIDPIQLIELCPQLRGLATHLQSDAPQLSAQINRVSPVYKQELFDSLDTHTTLLLYKWNFNISITSPWPWNKLSQIHTRPCFGNLAELEIAHFGSTRLSRSRWHVLAKELALSLGHLKNLSSICFQKCNWHQFQDLLAHTAGLKTLCFIDCENLSSTELGTLLHESGGNISELVLKHNRALHLGFTTSLADDCPNLQHLYVDFHCFNTSHFGGAAEPLFHAVLPGYLVPKWPPSLQSIELHYIRNFGTIDAATRFFKSIWSSAPSLPTLRKLVIRASIEQGWKERKDFRELWEERIMNAFHRVTLPPRQYHHQRTAKEQASAIPSTHEDVDSNSDAPIVSRIRSRKAPTEDLPSKESLAADTVSQATKDICQPMCNVVDLYIDNLRPMGTMFREEDFLDSEKSGDSDWDGNGDAADDGYAW